MSQTEWRCCFLFHFVTTFSMSFLAGTVVFEIALVAAVTCHLSTSSIWMSWHGPNNLFILPMTLFLLMIIVQFFFFFCMIIHFVLKICINGQLISLYIEDIDPSRLPATFYNFPIIPISYTACSLARVFVVGKWMGDNWPEKCHRISQSPEVDEVQPPPPETREAHTKPYGLHSVTTLPNLGLQHYNWAVNKFFALYTAKLTSELPETGSVSL